MSTMTKCRVAGGYVTGKSHIEKKTPCQDRTYSKTHNGITVITLADGAGSCKNSDTGAEIVTKVVADLICNNFTFLFKKTKEEISKNILNEILKHLGAKSKKLNVKLKDLSSTLLFAGVKGNQYIAGHIGDGLIGYYFNDSETHVKTLSEPENGEYANETFFTTSNDAIKHFRIYKDKLDKITGFILMSDGSYDCLFDKSKNVLKGANNTFYSWLGDISNPTEKIEQALIDNMKEQFITRTHDDCSINLLAITDEEFITTEPVFEEMKIDANQLANNTQNIENLQKVVSEIKNELSNLESIKSDVSKISKTQKDFAKITTDLKKDLDSQQKNIDKIKSKLTNKTSQIDNGSNELTTIIGDFEKWKRKTNIIIWGLITVVGVFLFALIKLIFFS
tara:strand:- start:3001 stop:4179 length:1179 start_codon:yes stop_codon:yes gene_type:complete